MALCKQRKKMPEKTQPRFAFANRGCVGKKASGQAHFRRSCPRIYFFSGLYSTAAITSAMMVLGSI